MKLIYLGSGEFGLATLQRLHAEHQVAAVLTQPDRPAGRGRRITATPIGQWAHEAGVTAIKADDANAPSVIEQVRDLHCDAGVVIAFGQKLSPALIESLGRLVVNLHASLLPKYRGAAPINWAIINGERQTGLSVIGLAQRMDAGLVYGQVSTDIDPTETAGELHDRLAQLGPELMCRVLSKFEAGTLQGKPQNDEQATRAPKLSRADAHLWFDVPAQQVRCRVHGLTPWPGAPVQWIRQDRDKHETLILRRVAAEPGGDRGDPPAAPGTVLPDCRVATSDGAVRLLEVQLPGGKAMTIEQFTTGHELAPGDALRP